jgi:hypothetical protein
VRTLDVLPPPGCSLSPAELAEQRGRAKRLVPAVVDVAGAVDALHVTFADDVDRTLLDELISTERSCCSFLVIDYHESLRRMRVVASDAQGREVVSRFRAFFAEEADG